MRTQKLGKHTNRILDCLFVNMVKWLTHLWNKNKKIQMESFRSSIIFVGGWIKYASAGCRDTSFPISFEAIHVDFDLYVWNSMSNFHKDIFGSFFVESNCCSSWTNTIRMATIRFRCTQVEKFRKIVKTIYAHICMQDMG